MSGDTNRISSTEQFGYLSALFQFNKENAEYGDALGKVYELTRRDLEEIENILSLQNTILPDEARDVRERIGNMSSLFRHFAENTKVLFSDVLRQIYPERESISHQEKVLRQPKKVLRQPKTAATNSGSSLMDTKGEISQTKEENTEKQCGYLRALSRFNKENAEYGDALGDLYESTRRDFGNIKNIFSLQNTILPKKAKDDVKERIKTMSSQFNDFAENSRVLFSKILRQIYPERELPISHQEKAQRQPKAAATNSGSSLTAAKSKISQTKKTNIELEAIAAIFTDSQQKIEAELARCNEAHDQLSDYLPVSQKGGLQTIRFRQALNAANNLNNRLEELTDSFDLKTLVLTQKMRSHKKVSSEKKHSSALSSNQTSEHILYFV